MSLGRSGIRQFNLAGRWGPIILMLLLQQSIVEISGRQTKLQRKHGVSSQFFDGIALLHPPRSPIVLRRSMLQGKKNIAAYTI